MPAPLVLALFLDRDGASGLVRFLAAGDRGLNLSWATGSRMERMRSWLDLPEHHVEPGRDEAMSRPASCGGRWTKLP